MSKEKMRRPLAATTAMMLARDMGYEKNKDGFESKAPKYEPWYMMQISKSERKGKTPEQIQELRRAKWEAIQ